MLLNAAHTVVEKLGKDEYVVILVKPDGERNYYVETQVDQGQTGAVYPMVSGTPDRARKFGLEATAARVAATLQSFLNTQYPRPVKTYEALFE